MNNVSVGVGVILVNKNKKILLCKRKSKHGEGTYSIPGGSVDLGEKIEECAFREIYEETGITIKSTKFIGVTNNIKTFEKEGMHSVSMIFYSNNFIGEPVLKEPSKHESWGWYDIINIPEPHFEASDLAVKLAFDKKDKDNTVYLME